MNDSSRNIVKNLKNIVLRVLKSILLKLLIPIIGVLLILSAFIYYLTIDDGTYREGDKSNAPYAVSQYTHNVSVNLNGEIETGMTAQELWDEMKKNNNRALKYLKTPEQLKKLMNAELLTQYLDTRENPDEPIKWDSKELNDVNSKYVQGIIKLKRADIDGNKSTMTYVDPETFQKYIDNYNASGSEEDRNKALKHFTLEMGTPTTNERDTNSGSDISSVSGGLFIGDSILGRMSSYLDGANVLYQVSANANFYLGKVGSPHSDNNLGLNVGQHFDWNKISAISNPKFIYIVLGQNLCSGGASGVNTKDIEELVKKLQNQFPNVPIYINSVVPSGTNFTYNKSYNEGQVELNKLLKKYCSSTHNVTYVNTLEGYIQGDGNANPSYVDSADGLHPNPSGAKLIVENITKGNVVKEDSDTDKKKDKKDKEESDDESEEESQVVSQKVFAKVATWTEQSSKTESNDPEVENSIQNTYNMSSTNINYQNAVGKVTMPFDYLWSILTVTENVDLVLELADLVYNSEIEITVHDNIEIQTNVNKNTYTKTVEEVEKDKDGKETKKTKTVEYTVTKTVITRTNTLNIALTKADVWMEKYTQKFVQGEPTVTTTTAGANSNTIQKINYVASTPKVKEKTDANSKDENFVKILVKGKYNNARYMLTDEVYSWWMEILEGNKSTVDMIDLTKYLLYKINGKDYGVTEYDFNIYEEINFVDVGNSTGASASELLVSYIHYYEHSTPPPTNADGTKYIIEDDGAGNPVVGYGVDIYNSGYLSLFQAGGYPTNVGGEVDKAFVDELEKKAIKDKAAGIKSGLSGLKLTDYQMNALISRAYNCGVSGAIGVRNGKTFLQAYNSYWNQKRDDYFEKKKNSADFGHQLYTQYMNEPVTNNKGEYMKGLETRRKSEWTLFQTGYYDVLNEWHSDAQGGTIIEVAKRIHEYMEANKYSYALGNLDSTFEKSKTGHHNTCCATYVSWVLQEAGYVTESEHISNNLNYANNFRSALQSKGFKVINNQADLQAGDILCYDNHVEIYAGNNTIYNAGSENAIRSASPRPLYRAFEYALRAPK